ncbi:MAG: uncharacterized protein KVP18_005134 [Porospora cf. gigantea A]|uniref:uncharacterized protein n=1 Tax=Porospora cf. gigantea A TaxID=2853593 RepID=UPI00355A4D2D|nr:MAG: hypothetical protein KVP18_005134 [Porospora cf. gigantea A]
MALRGTLDKAELKQRWDNELDEWTRWPSSKKKAYARCLMMQDLNNMKKPPDMPYLEYLSLFVFPPLVYGRQRRTRIVAKVLERGMRHFLSITHEQRLPQNLGQCSRSLTNLLLLHMSDTLTTLFVLRLQELYSSCTFPDTIIELSEVVDDVGFTSAEDLEKLLASRLTSDLASSSSERGLSGLFSTFFGGKTRSSAIWTQERSELSTVVYHSRAEPPPLPPAETSSRRLKRLDSESEERRKARNRKREIRRQWADNPSSVAKLAPRGGERLLDRKEELPDTIRRKDDTKCRPRLREDSPSLDTQRKSPRHQRSKRNRRPKSPQHSETGYSRQPYYADVQPAYGKYPPESVYEYPPRVPSMRHLSHPGSQAFSESPAFSLPLSASPYPPYPPYPVMYVTYHMAPPGYPPGLYPPSTAPYPPGLYPPSTPPYPQGPYAPPGHYLAPQAPYPYKDRKRHRSLSSNRQSSSSTKHIGDRMKKLQSESS